MHGDLLPGLEVGGGGVLGQVLQGGGVHRDHCGQVQLPPADGLQGEQGGHNLGDAGGVALLVGSLLIENLVGVQVHQQGSGGLDGDILHPSIVHSTGKGDQQAGEQ